MPRITKPLTDTQVKQAKPKAKEYNLVDGGGLALRIKPSGSKLWLFNYYRPYSKKRANLSLGAYPSLSLANVRLKRYEYRELLAKDIDPKEYKDAQTRKETEAHQNTLKHVAAQWLEVKKTSVSTNHAEDTWRSLELHVFPDLGAVPIHKITAKQAIAYIQPLARKGYLETVKRVCQRLNEIMVYSTNTGLITANPLAGIGKAFGVPDTKHMPTIRPEELPKLMDDIEKASIRVTTRCLLKWQLHSMVRPSEASGTRWSEIDLDKKLWTIPPERMKKKRSHTVPLSKQAIELLEEIRPLSGIREHVFPADRKPREASNSQTANMALKRMGYGGILTAHGMRSIASTLLNEQGFDSDVIESALAHSEKDNVRAAYNRAEYLERRRVLMAWWSEYIEQAATENISLTGKKRLKSVEV